MAYNIKNFHCSAKFEFSSNLIEFPNLLEREEIQGAQQAEGILMSKARGRVGWKETHLPVGQLCTRRCDKSG